MQHLDDDRLDALSDAVLDEPDGAAVRAHLHNCAPCQQVVVAHQRVRATLQALEDPIVTPALMSRLLAIARGPLRGETTTPRPRAPAAPRTGRPARHRRDAPPAEDVRW
jgi:hypothetical protein